MTELKKMVKEHGISPENLMIISSNFHEQKNLGYFQLKKKN